MAIDINKKIVNVHKERYEFSVGEHNWDIIYSVFSYPFGEDKPENSVDESLRIHQEYPNEFRESGKGHFQEIMYLKDGGVKFQYGELFSFIPVLDAYNKDLETEIRSSVAKSLSDGALNLFQKGLERYEEIRADK